MPRQARNYVACPKKRKPDRAERSSDHVTTPSIEATPGRASSVVSRMEGLPQTTFEVRAVRYEDAREMAELLAAVAEEGVVATASAERVPRACTSSASTCSRTTVRRSRCIASLDSSRRGGAFGTSAARTASSGTRSSWGSCSDVHLLNRQPPRAHTRKSRRSSFFGPRVPPVADSEDSAMSRTAKTDRTERSSTRLTEPNMPQGWRFRGTSNPRAEVRLLPG